MTGLIEEIRRLYLPIFSIDYALSILDWDIATYMPRKVIEKRKFVMAELEKLRRKLILRKEVKEFIKKAGKEELNEIGKGMLRELKREIEIYEKLPEEFLEEFEKIRREARVVWEEAKKKSKFKLFLPYLEKIVELTRKKAEYLGYEKHPYDALIDLFEEGFRKRDLDKFFKELKPIVKKRFEKIRKSENYIETHPLEKEKYDKEKMRELNLLIAKEMGYDFERGRIDISAHPFTLDLPYTDIRFTTWYHEKDFRRSLFATIHECGHALHHLQINPELWGTPAGFGSFYALGESQSRFWENYIGRSYEFVKAHYKIFCKYLPFLKNYSKDDVYRYFNLVRPEVIRVESDEITYHFHVLLRYEVEIGLIEEKINAKEVPEIWNEKMEKYLGIIPKKDSEGVLQDVHWSEGYFGYFPTYSIGSVLAVSIGERMKEELKGIEKDIEKRKFERIRDWLKKNIHWWGAVYTTKELAKRIGIDLFNLSGFKRYLKEKFEKIY